MLAGVDDGEIAGDGNFKATRFCAPFEGVTVNVVFNLGAALAFERKMARLTPYIDVADAVSDDDGCKEVD